jgi:hypothetical protein
MVVESRDLRIGTVKISTRSGIFLDSVTHVLKSQ